jgi:hypothetical protein
MRRGYSKQSAVVPALAAFDLDDTEGLSAFLREPGKRTGVAMTRLGTNAAAVLGAYVFALEQLDSAPRSR